MTHPMPLVQSGALVTLVKTALRDAGGASDAGTPRTPAKIRHLKQQAVAVVSIATQG